MLKEKTCWSTGVGKIVTVNPSVLVFVLGDYELLGGGWVVVFPSVLKRNCLVEVIYDNILRYVLFLKSGAHYKAKTKLPRACTQP